MIRGNDSTMEGFRYQQEVEQSGQISKIGYLQFCYRRLKISEGVECKEEVDLLKSWSVDMIQGFYYARPMPGDEIRCLAPNFNRGDRQV